MLRGVPRGRCLAPVPLPGHLQPLPPRTLGRLHDSLLRGVQLAVRRRQRPSEAEAALPETQLVLEPTLELLGRGHRGPAPKKRFKLLA